MNEGYRTKRAGRRALPLVLALGLGFAGCDEFLTTEPKGELTTSSFFETSEQAIQATNATYAMLRNWQVHVFSYLGLTDIVSDDATKGSVPADAGFLGDMDFLNFDPGNLAFQDPWGGYYQGIYRANVAIVNIPSITMDATLQNRLVGENKFLRAYYYFFLARGWGGVPLILEALAPGEYVQPRATADEVFAQIEQDLLDAIAVLPAEYGAADIGRATRGAAQALLARVYLFRGDYAGALTQAQAVINSGLYDLSTDYHQIFTPAGENNPGSIFEVQALALEGGNNGPGGAAIQYAEVQGVRGDPNLGWGFNTPSPALEESYEPGDPRLHATIMYPWELLPDGSGLVVYLNGSMPNNRYNQKVFTPPDNPGGTGNSGVNIRLIRYADVLLIAAEAAYQEGQLGLAQDYLNQVRARARDGRTRTLGLNVETLAPQIADGVLNLSTSSRVAVRYVNPSTGAYDAGVRSFTSTRDDGVAPVPVRVGSLDIVEAVAGTPVSTVDQYRAAVEAQPIASIVAVDIVRVEHPESGVTETDMTVNVPVTELLPDFTGGEGLLDAIWRERRSELAMEQHRWYDLVRQGRAAEVMNALTCEDRALAPGCTPINFISGTHELFPIPSLEVEVASLTQNPGY